jgi:hypothetical protein
MRMNVKPTAKAFLDNYINLVEAEVPAGAAWDQAKAQFKNALKIKFKKDQEHSKKKFERCVERACRGVEKYLDKEEAVTA